MTTYSFSNSPRYPTIHFTTGVDLSGYSAPTVRIVLTDSGEEFYRDEVEIVSSDGTVSYDFDNGPPLENTEYSIQFEVYEGDALQTTVPETPHTLRIQSGKGGGGGGGNGEAVEEFGKISAKKVTTPHVDSGITDANSIHTDQASIGGGEPITQSVEHYGPRSGVTVGLCGGLVGHWPLNNLEEGLTDHSGNGNDISLVGSPTVSSKGGAFGDGVRFGGGNYGEINHNGALSVEDGPFTITCYVRAYDLSNQGMIIHKRAPTSPDTEMSYGLGLTWDAGRGAVVSGFGHGGGTLGLSRSPTSVGEGPLYAIALTFDPQHNRVTTYVNGQSWATKSFLSGPYQGNQDVRIGVKLNGSGNVDFDGDVILSDLRVFDRKLSQHEIRTLARLPRIDTSQTFDIQRRESVFGGSVTGPVYRYDDSFADPHRLMVKDRTVSGNPVKLYTSSDLSNWTEAATGLFGAYSNASGTEPSDYINVGGTLYVYATNDSDNTTHIFSGSDWTTQLTYEGGPFTGDVDCGVYYDGSTVYVYAEDKDFQVGFGSDKLALWTASSPTGSYTEQGTVVDLTDVPWHTGDPDIERINGTYWMFTDNTTNHPHYGTALYHSDDLYNWELVEESVKWGKGGDLEVAQTPEGLIGFTEMSGADNLSVDLWDVWGPQ